MNNTDKKQEINCYKTFWITLTGATIGVIFMKQLLASLFFSQPIGNYAAMWGANAVVSYLPSLLIFGIMFTRAPKPEQMSEYTFKYALLPVIFASMYTLSIFANLFSHYVAALFDALFGTGALADPFAPILPESVYEWIVMCVAVGVVSAIAEEVIYRRLLLQPLRRFGDKTAVTVTALLFAAFHANLTQFLYAFVGGVILAVVTIRANSLKPAIILHMSNNIFTMLILGLNNETAASIAPYVVMVPGIIATVVLFRGGHFTVTDNNPHLTARERARIALTHPAVIILVVVLAGLVVLGSV
ncbi:MAG: CPBP family intramembrane metalloprotease [Oscillospiraceae bacterium]|nr:CPBP family intramembrane metalloprotease [Oscillospiraceae bacterium]